MHQGWVLCIDRLYAQTPGRINTFESTEAKQYMETPCRCNKGYTTQLHLCMQALSFEAVSSAGMAVIAHKTSHLLIKILPQALLYQSKRSVIVPR